VSGNHARLGCDAPTYPDCGNNPPANIAAQGGGLRNLAAWDENVPKGVFIGESVFEDNEANQGGAIFNGFDLRDQNPPGGVIIEDTKFTSNEALPITLPNFEGPAGGGAIFNFGVLAIEDSTFLTNYAPEGGAIYNSSQLLLQDADRPEDPRDVPEPKNLQQGIAPAAAAAAQQVDLPEDPGGMNITDTTFFKNEANDGNGGAIFSSGTMTQRGERPGRRHLQHLGVADHLVARSRASRARQRARLRRADKRDDR
jgi:predicted outer membrane repeat protein